jgi:zinc D-Ala-D-Ala carboxypeptidase
MRKMLFSISLLLAITISGYGTLSSESLIYDSSDFGRDTDLPHSSHNSNEVKPGKSVGTGKSNSIETHDAPQKPHVKDKPNPHAIAVIAKPELIAVLVNKSNKLPEGYEPEHLVFPDVKFTFNEKIEKRMMRKDAADALKDLFKAAEDDGIELAGVSAYRSHERQKQLFESYVRRDGHEKARTYSAVPGTSEHETGLAIDVTGSNGKCAAEDCFAGTPEAEWIEDHAHEYGFIVRYPKGKERITGYKYEPWHIRYVGVKTASKIYEKGITLEEYIRLDALSAEADSSDV